MSEDKAVRAARLRTRLLERRLAAQRITRADRTKPLPLSFAQQRLWLLEQLRPGGLEYLIPVALRIEGVLDVAALRHALDRVVARHEVLRTRYVSVDNVPMQVIDEHAEIRVDEVDLRELKAGERERRLTELLAAEGRRPFSLQAELPFRTTLYRLTDTESVLLVTVHHIAFDGWSADILRSELVTGYQACQAGSPDSAPPLPVQYADFAAWQREQNTSTSLGYWREQLAGLGALPLLTDRPYPPEWDPSGAAVRFEIPAELADAATELGRAHGCTPFMVLLAAVQALLARHTAQSDVAVGTPMAGRTEADVADLIGFFTNTLVLRVDVSEDMSFGDLLAKVEQATLEAFDHQDVPFEQLVNELRPTRDLARNPLFQVAFVYEVDAGGSGLSRAARISEIPVEWTPAKFELTFAVRQRQDGVLAAHIEYATALFDRSTANSLAECLVALLRAVTADPGTLIGEIDLGAGNSAPRPSLSVPAPACLHTLVERRAQERPGSVAISHGSTNVTYAQLNRRANRLAHHLIALGAGPGSLVGVRMNRGECLVIALLAILKTGAGYLPLDPAQPAGRTGFMVDDSAVTTVLTEQSLASDLAGTVDHLVVLDDMGLRSRLADLPDVNPAPRASLDDLAYVIYTSGSTGQPKGVMVSHRNVVRLFAAAQPRFHFGHEDVWTLFHSYAFDFSVWEIWGALTYGGRLVVVPFEVSRSPEDFAALLSAEAVTVLNQTPSAFANLLGVPADQVGPLAVRAVVFGGEALDVSALAPWFARYGDKAQMINMYGITETTVHVTYREVVIADTVRHGGAGRSPIGAPLADLELHVLDAAMRPVPPGIPGELYVGGAGLARGYLNRPRLTGERFVPDAYSGRPGARLYRTGDRARLMPDGEIEFLGRVDDQVKIHGFRIETGEVESAITQYGPVEAAVVVAQGDGADRQLVGYVVPRREAEFDGGALRAYLTSRLPRYMIPARFVRLDVLPLTANGKVNRRALPEPARVAVEAGRDHVPPVTPVEHAMAEVWADVLHAERIGTTDNFFELGGDSIRAVRVVGRLRADGIPVTVQDLFRHQTITALAASTPAGRHPVAEDRRVLPMELISAADRAALPAGVVDAYPLSDGQAGMVYEMMADPDLRPYHNAACFLVRDNGPFSLDALRLAVQAMTERHEVLRTSIELTGYSTALQLVYGKVDVAVDHVDLREVDPAAHERFVDEALGAQRRDLFDLTRPGLWRLAVYQEADDRWRFALVECHAILDGWSHHALITEMLAWYRAFRDGTAPDVAAAPVTRYADFVRMEQTAVESGDREFWAGRFDLAEKLVLPVVWADPEPGPDPVYDIHVPYSHLEPALRQLAAAAGASMKSVLLTAHLKVMSMLTDQPRFVTGLVSNGRLETVDGDRTFGMHLNVVPFVSPEFTGSWCDVVRAVFAEEVALWPHRRYPMGAMRRDQGRGDALVDVGFNYLDFHVLDRESVDVSATVDRSPNEVHWGVSTEWGRLVLVGNAQSVAKEYGMMLGRLYSAVLTAMATDGSASAAGSLLPAVDRRHLLDQPATVTEVVPRTLYDIVAHWAERTPGAEALVYGGTKLTYARLIAEADRLAVRLHTAGVGRGSVVGLCLPRGVHLIVAELAVSRAGGAFLPLDPGQPVARIEFMLTDAGVRHLVQTEAVAADLGDLGREVILVDSHEPPPTAVDLPAVDTEDIAYVIYTSGSTGRPKGVAVPHRGLAHMVATHAEHVGIEPGERVLQLASPIFDISIFEILLALGQGATLVTAAPERLVPGEPLAELICAERVTHLAIVPSALALLPTDGYTPRVVVVGGEECPPALAERWSSIARFVNGYGPTETTVWATVDTCVPGTGRLTIGRAINGARAYVVDPDLRPRLTGVPGELVVGGMGVATGYLGRPGLTAERFVPDPFGDQPGGRLYRTGDRVRRLADGRIDFLGRLDSQVKIRGHRVELGEIEAYLHEHPSVRQAVVTTFRSPGGDLQVAGYYTTAGQDVPSADVAAFLGTGLPGYMVPSALIQVPEFPRTPTGKLDRNALPSPATGDVSNRHEYVVPRTATEQVVASTWEEIFGAGRVGAYDDFFMLGGHSLLAMRCVSLLAQRLGRPVVVGDLLTHRTVAGLAAFLDDPTGASRDDRALVWLRREGDQAPAFCVHPGGGSVHWYRDLASLLPPGVPVAALQHPAVVDPRMAGLDITELAGLYLREVLPAQPSGPYRLFGWCGGGPVTWELARLLRERGDEVSLLLLDPTVDITGGGEQPEVLRMLREAEVLLGELVTTEDQARAAEIRAEVAPTLRRAVDDDGGVEITPDSVGPEWLDRIRTWCGLHDAALAYRYPKIDLHLRLVLGDELLDEAHESIDGLALDDYLDRWHEVASGGVTVCPVPGNHLGVLAQPHVSGLADLIGAAWDTDERRLLAAAAVGDE
ncbi:hypothetical protein ALI144C_07565 [Actinosynnema sp. ALI-1.44]|uniref:non-ribosomal peptide synthetase n=1 Tax=Actinosynnema sp. ALI-1.44 TaxID=1933779 RepID=UPI00097C0EA6|nr:non-ribosomal peptide synthetase [Actinosynnema sp. ALI-1.44]ONI88284.1 hypothetical protein ALI144C_07565 [Actinosynnema sp. ALI-1.44]